MHGREPGFSCCSLAVGLNLWHPACEAGSRFCGEAYAEMWLRKQKAPVDQDYVYDQSGLDPLFGRGYDTKELSTALRKMGFKIGPECTTIKVSAAEAGLG